MRKARSRRRWPTQRGVLVGEPLHRHDRPEHFTLDDLGVLADAGDDRRLVVEARAVAARAAGHDLGAGLAGPVHHGLDAVPLFGRHDGPELGRLVARVADHETARGVREPGDEVVVDAGAGEDAAGGGAVLPALT